MEENSKLMWIQPKVHVNTQIGMMYFVMLGSIVALFCFWNTLDVRERTIFILTPIVGFVYLSMFVKYLELKGDHFLVQTAYRAIKLDYNAIVSIQMKQRIGKQFVEIRLKQPIYVRRRITFNMQENGPQIVACLNIIKSKVPVPLHLTDNYKLNEHTGEIEPV
jgi:hypothetical protein